MAVKHKAAPGRNAPVVALEVDAEALRLRARAGDEAVTRVRVTNRGPVALALDSAGAIPLRKSGALARGVRKAFKGQSGDFISKLIDLGKQLEEEPTVTATISYKADFEALQPGQSAEVEIHLRIPENVEAETGWTARLPVLGTTVAADLEIALDRPKDTRPRGGSGDKHRTRKGDDA